MASKEVWSTTPDTLVLPKKLEDAAQTSFGPSTSTPKAGPKSWKRRLAKAKEEKTFAHVDDLLMSDSEDELEDDRSATDNLNETENFANLEDEETSEYSDEFEIDDIGCSNLLNQPSGTQNKSLHGASIVRSECRICSQILPTTRLSAHEALPHPVPCTYEGCEKKFILEKTLERHIRKAHIPKAPTPTLISTQLSRSEEVVDTSSDLLDQPKNTVKESSRSGQDVLVAVSGDAGQYPNNANDKVSALSLDVPVAPANQVDTTSPVSSKNENTHGDKKLENTIGLDNNHQNMDENCNHSYEEDLPSSSVNLAISQGNELPVGIHGNEKNEIPNPANIDVDEVSEPDRKEIQINSKVLENEKDGEEKVPFEEPPGPYICKFCKEEYKSWGTLTRHFITPHLFKCEFCDLVFNRKSTLEDHINMLHDLVGLIDSTQCGMCGETFSRSSTLARHIAAPHNYPCRKCEKKFQSKPSLTKHNILCPNKHLVIEEEEPTKNSPKVRKRTYKKTAGSPPKRRKKSKMVEALESDEEDSEIEIDSNEKSVDRDGSKSHCSDISYGEENGSSDDELNLSQRLENIKRPKSEIAIDVSECKNAEISEPKIKKCKITSICKICDQTISGGASSFKIHQNKDHKYACDLCNKKFIMKSKLKHHKESFHTSETLEFECEFCLFKVFSGTKISLTLVKNKIQKHKALTHNFRCDECDLKFVSAERLSYHKSNNHAAKFETDFHCMLCDRIFENKDESKRIIEFLDHIETIHNFSCDYCTLKFISSNALKKHSEDVHKNETHCHKCKIEFSQEELHKHVKVPHPYDCDECDFHFITEERLRYHCMNLHDKEDIITTVCNECNYNIEELEDFLNHIEVKHGDECPQCSLSFIDDTSLNVHLERQHPKIEFVCCQCGLNFEEEEIEYKKHTVIEHKFKCRFCDKIFIKKHELLKHISDEHADLKFGCKWCGKAFEKRFEDFEMHENKKHDMHCRYCEKKFIQKASLVTHTTSCHVEKNFFCKLCSLDFHRDFEKCLEHEDINHEFKCENCDKCFVEKSIHDKHSLEVHGVSVGLDLKCGQCQERFSNTGAFREHFKVPHKIFCSLCDLKFPSHVKLNEHLSKSHQKSSKVEKLVCQLCNKKFESRDKAEFIEHQNMKHKYKCDNCDMMFVKSGRLRDHIDEAHGHSKSIDNRFTCKLCRTICNKKNDMKLSKEAYKMHCSLPHKFPCRNCDLRFASKSKLDTHMQTNHNEVSANECPICGSRFSDLRKLRDHKNEPHRFNCKDVKCKKRFVNESSLEKHLQRKHKEFAQATFKDGHVLFRCKMCSKSFDSNLALQSHQYVKHSFQCHLCDSSYIEKDDLTVHLVRIHRVEKIPQAGFRCKLCKFESKKMIETRKHLSLSHKYQCNFCRLMYTNKNHLDAHMEENHMDQVMIAMEGGKSIEDEEALEKQPHLARLGVNVLLWAGSKQVVKHLHKVMEGKTSSTRHKLFMNKQEREECCRSEDSTLYKLSGSRFLNLPTPTDQAMLEVCSETYRSGQPILHGISKDKFTFEYVTCVLIPEMWILYFRKLKGFTSGEAEKKFVEKLEPEKTLDAWKEFEDAITKWKIQQSHKPEINDSEPIPKEHGSINSKTDDMSSKIRDVNQPSQTSGDVENKCTESQTRKLVDPRIQKKADPRLQKSGDPRIQRSIDSCTGRSGEGSLPLTPIAQPDLENNKSGPYTEMMEEPGNKTPEKCERPEKEVPDVDVEELDTIAQFLENSS